MFLAMGGLECFPRKTEIFREATGSDLHSTNVTLIAVCVDLPILGGLGLEVYRPVRRLS